MADVCFEAHYGLSQTSRQVRKVPMNRRQPTPSTGQSRATAVLSRELGKVVLDGTADELRDHKDVKEFYLGGTGDQRKNLKRFKRRKRWL